MPLFGQGMTGQRLDFGDLLVKIEVFQISEPILRKVLRLATCDFHERVPWTISIREHAFEASALLLSLRIVWEA